MTPYQSLMNGNGYPTANLVLLPNTISYLMIQTHRKLVNVQRVQVCHDQAEMDLTITLQDLIQF